MNFYRQIMGQPLDVFEHYKFNPESEQDREMIIMMG